MRRAIYSIPALVTGAVMLAIPAVLAPGPGWLLAVIGGIGLVLAVAPWRWPAAPTVAAGAAILLMGVTLALRPVPLWLAGVEGMLILAHLLLADAPDAPPTRGVRHWAGARLRVLAGAAAVTATVAAVAALPPSPVPWLVLAAPVAAVAAVLLAART